MANFTVNFTNPWLLLLFIPAVVFTLLPYFMLAKRYRRTRNRIISISLHLIIMALSILVLAGITFAYNSPNTNNEILILVDTSFSNREARETRNEFVKQVIDESGSNFKIGVVNFGYDQVYAAEMSTDGEKVYGDYINALDEFPVDESGTDIASALRYADGLFTDPRNAKIVLISDGLQTDGDALTAVKQLSSEGVRVSVLSCIPEEHSEIQLIGAELPDHSVTLDEKFTIGLTISSSYEGHVDIAVYDNDVKADSKDVYIYEGTQTVDIEHTISTTDMHEIRFEVTGGTDTVTQNNELYTYLDIKEFKKVLILERYTGEGDKLREILEGEYNYETDLIDIGLDAASVPRDLSALRNSYHQVILVNFANSDFSLAGMPENFDMTLNQFVSVAGGSVFTVGGLEPGTESDPTPHAYNREDMYSADAFKEMLPVQVVDYTPPMGIELIIDCSASMSVVVSGGKNMLDLAKDSALQCLNALSYHDYLGVLSLEGSYTTEVPICSVLERQRIEEAIKNIPMHGDTTYYPGLSRAYQELNSLGDKVAKKHIILISDGLPDDDLDETKSGKPPFGPLIDNNYNNNDVTLSVITIDSGDGEVDFTLGERMAERGHGKAYTVNARTDPNQLIDQVRQDISRPEMLEVDYEPYVPTVAEHTVVVQGITDAELSGVELGGFFGVRAKEKSVTSLSAPHSPLYTQWTYGRGKVGSFMCTLDGGAWSQQFMSSAAGRMIINNMVRALMPTEEIAELDIRAEMDDGNYVTRLSIMTSLEEDDYIEVTITSPPDEDAAEEVVQTFYPGMDSGQTRVNFTVVLPGIKREGLHKVVVRKVNSAGEEISRFETYKVLSYSKEYNAFHDEDEGAKLLQSLADSGNGELVETDGALNEIFTDFETIVHKVIDPRLAFMITAIVLFLLDIAVRKFKFKWIHELIRESREKKRLGGNKK